MTQYMQEAGAMKQADELMELARQYAHAYYNAYTGSHDGMLHKTREALRAALAAALPPAAVQAGPTEAARLIACEDALRSLASWLGVGGYNAPEVDAKVFEAKIRDGVTIYSQLHGIAAARLAEVVLAMDLITPKGIRARELARQVLGIAPLAANEGTLTAGKQGGDGVRVDATVLTRPMTDEQIYCAWDGAGSPCPLDQFKRIVQCVEEVHGITHGVARLDGSTFGPHTPMDSEPTK